MTATVEHAPNVPLQNLSAALKNPETSAYDLVTFALHALYTANEQNLRTQVAELEDRLQELDKLNRFRNYLSQFEGDGLTGAKGPDKGLDTLFTESEFDVKTSSVYAGDGTTVIGQKYEFENGWSMIQYTADDDRTANFNELTGTNSVTTEIPASTDANGTTIPATSETQYFAFGAENDDDSEPAGATYRSVIFDAEGNAVQEIVSWKDPVTGEGKTRIYDLTEVPLVDVNDDDVDDRFNAQGGGAFRPTQHDEPIWFSNDGKTYERTLVEESSTNDTHSLKIGEGDDAITLEIGETNGLVSALSFFKEDEATGYSIEFKDPDVPQTDFTLVTNRSERVDEKIDTEIELESENSEGDQTTSQRGYQGQIEQSEEVWLKIGFSDEDGTGSVWDDAQTYLIEEVGIDPSLFNGVLNEEGVKTISGAIDTKSESLLSINQISMLQIEKSFNATNVITTMWANIIAGNTRALLSVANGIV